jgi:2-oxoglutarate dehydrogenase E2 component (dihydrolipoamide succinyltransferase)
MKIDMLMPQMGESITEATISRWLKQPGDAVQKDELILEISTDKVDSEIPAPESGILTEILFKEGDVVPVREKIAVIDTEASASASKQTAKPSTTETIPSTGSQPTDTEEAPAGAVISPLVKNLAASNNIPLAEIAALKGSGAGGRFTKSDFYEYLAKRSQSGQKPASTAVVSTAAVSTAGTPKSSDAAKLDIKKDGPAVGEWASDGTMIVPMDRMRQAIADHMVRSKHTSPHVYSVQEVDVTKIAQWRAKHKGSFSKSEGFNLSFTPFFLEAAVRALLKFPIVNSSVQDKSIIMKRHINLGCAVALGNTGLIVPVIKRAEELTLKGLARGLNDLAGRARDKKLLPDDVAGGTFTVTNPGVFGTMIGTPIINQPQVAILCLGAIKKRPVVIDDMIAIRDMCYLTLSYDHRVIDGSTGGMFLAEMREYLENWDLTQSLR